MTVCLNNIPELVREEVEQSLENYKLGVNLLLLAHRPEALLTLETLACWTKDSTGYCLYL